MTNALSLKRTWYRLCSAQNKGCTGFGSTTKQWSMIIHSRLDDLDSRLVDPDSRSYDPNRPIFQTSVFNKGFSTNDFPKMVFEKCFSKTGFPKTVFQKTVFQKRFFKIGWPNFEFWPKNNFSLTDTK